MSMMVMRFMGMTMAMEAIIVFELIWAIAEMVMMILLKHMVVIVVMIFGQE